MQGAHLSYEEAVGFKNTWDKCGGDTWKVAQAVGLSHRVVMTKRRKVEKFLGTELRPSTYYSKSNFPEYQNLRFDRKSEYRVLIGSDKHNLPGRRPQAFKAFLDLAESIKPEVVIINGDWYDFPAISKHHRIGWSEVPSIKDELEWGTADLEDIKAATPKAKRFFNLGNHDMRFDGKLSNCLPEAEGIQGCHLEDHIKGYDIGLSVVLNDTLIVKHRWHGGIHSSYNDVLRGGKNIATGHDHKLNIRPWTDYSGTRYGIKTGTLSDLWDEAFIYTENNSCDWQPGCAVITIDGDEIFPEPCPMTINKTHRRWGKIRYQGQFFG